MYKCHCIYRIHHLPCLNMYGLPLKTRIIQHLQVILTNARTHFQNHENVNKHYRPRNAWKTMYFASKSHRNWLLLLWQVSNNTAYRLYMYFTIQAVITSAYAPTYSTGPHPRGIPVGCTPLPPGRRKLINSTAPLKYLFQLHTLQCIFFINGRNLPHIPAYPRPSADLSHINSTAITLLHRGKTISQFPVFSTALPRVSPGVGGPGNILTGA